jgi:hypothetical protein
VSSFSLSASLASLSQEFSGVSILQIQVNYIHRLLNYDMNARGMQLLEVVYGGRLQMTQRLCILMDAHCHSKSESILWRNSYRYTMEKLLGELLFMEGSLARNQDRHEHGG